MGVPFGAWPSPISATAVAAGSRRLGAVSIDRGEVYWLESRPLEGGRTVLVKRTAGGSTADVTPVDANVRSRVHEYGGGAYAVSDGLVLYSEFRDARLYAIHAGEVPRAITPQGPWRYADGRIHPTRQFALFVREEHSTPDVEPTNTLVRIALDSDYLDAGDVVVQGHDFYAGPRFSPDGRRICWLAWRHPQMPWDGTELWIAEIGERGDLLDARLVAGGANESIFQPGWSATGDLVFVSDRSGWWNLYRAREGRDAEPLCAMPAEFGYPLWQFHASTWAPANGHLVCAFAREGRWQLGMLDTATHALTTIARGIEPAESVMSDGRVAVCLTRSAGQPESVVQIDLTTGTHEVVRTALSEVPAPSFISVPEPITFPTTDEAIAHAWFYRPHNAEVVPPVDERPPLLVISHGGPTTATSPDLKLAIQFWTSRGFAVVDVDYRGSTGYGRTYRDALKGRWGEVDVEDCLAAVRHLVASNLVDPTRLAIRGASAGGYTTLAALTFHPGVFGAGASYFGVSDLEVLARDTHKFEARYLDSLVGPYPAAREVYVARSPVHYVDRLACALILFQGLDDRVVPPSQSQMMADAVRAKGLPVALLTFEGEQHGFRRADTIQRCLEAELAFYATVFGFAPADVLPPLDKDRHQ